MASKQADRMFNSDLHLDFSLANNKLFHIVHRTQFDSRDSIPSNSLHITGISGLRGINNGMIWLCKPLSI